MASSSYIKGARIWLPDPTSGWLPGTVSSLSVPPSPAPTAQCELVVTFDTAPSAGEATRTLKFPYSALQQADSALTVVPTTPAPGQDALPPLRNPPSLETVEDLANLSILNEPSGECWRGRLWDLLMSQSCMLYPLDMR